MSRRALLLPIFLIVASCGVFGPADEPPERPAPPPVWNGDFVLCGKPVSFVLTSTDPLPVFSGDERLGFCAISVRYLILHRQYGAKSDVFGASAAVTGSYSSLYTLFRRAHLSRSTWGFLAQLSRRIETRAPSVVSALASGASRGSFNRRNDAEEQILVQTALDAFQLSQPGDYAKLMADMSKLLNPTGRFQMAAINRDPFFRALEASLAPLRAEFGGPIDYALLDHRLRIGTVLQKMISDTTEPGG